MNCDTIRSELDVSAQLWFYHFARWPARNFSDMAKDADFLPDGLPVCPVDGRSYEFDSVKRRVTPHSH